ncbi:MAG: DUF5615 family PIN-like protein [Pirellulales bacterium]
MARLYANENFPLPVVVKLRERDHDVLTITDTGHAGRSWPDHEVLVFAKRDGRALLTHNRRHFIRLHQEDPVHSGIIACTVDADFVALAERIHAAIGEHTSLEGVLIRVNRPGAKNGS